MGDDHDALSRREYHAGLSGAEERQRRMKKLLPQIIIAAVLVAVLGVVAYVGIKKITGLFSMPDIGAAQRQLDELVSDIERARGDLSGLRDSVTAVEGGLSDLAAKLDGSAASAARLEERIDESIRRERELEKILGGAAGATRILAEGIGKNEAALLRLREYIDGGQADGGYRASGYGDGP